MGLFKTKCVDRYVADWQFESFETLIRDFGGPASGTVRSLWLPIDAHFGTGRKGASGLTGAALIEFTLDRICQQYDIIDPKHISLEYMENAKSAFLGGAAVVNPVDNMAAGTYQQVLNPDGSLKEIITCEITLADDPINLIATIAHELAHAAHNRMIEPLEIDPELYELFTDLTSIFFGYGVFSANSRFSMTQNDLGWARRGTGYLPEADQIFATALFMKLNDIPEDRADKYLKPNLKKLLGKAFKQLSSETDRLEHLKNVAAITSG